MDGDLLAIYSRGTQLTPAHQSIPASRVHQCQIEQNRAPGGGHFIFFWKPVVPSYVHWVFPSSSRRHQRRNEYTGLVRVYEVIITSAVHAALGRQIMVCGECPLKSRRVRRMAGMVLLGEKNRHPPERASTGRISPMYL